VKRWEGNTTLQHTTTDVCIIAKIVHSTFKSDRECEPTQKQISLYDFTRGVGGRKALGGGGFQLR